MTASKQSQAGTAFPFRYNISIPFSSGKGEEVPVFDFLTAEAGADWMSRNVGTELSFCAGNTPRRWQITSTS
jgi:hypothetical protein